MCCCCTALPCSRDKVTLLGCNLLKTNESYLPTWSSTLRYGQNMPAGWLAYRPSGNEVRRLDGGECFDYGVINNKRSEHAVETLRSSTNLQRCCRMCRKFCSESCRTRCRSAANAADSAANSAGRAAESAGRAAESAGMLQNLQECCRFCSNSCRRTCRKRNNSDRRDTNLYYSQPNVHVCNKTPIQPVLCVHRLE